MRKVTSYGFDLLFHYMAGYFFGFALIISGAWLFLNLCAWVFFG
tara:strand:- start:1050 stop:1181 length:132 start_codon:yes stop_codon:yes gene_type:complete